MIARQINAKLYRVGKRVFHSGLEWLYPGKCDVCGTAVQGGYVLCAECMESIPRIEEPFCQRCSEPFPGNMEQGFKCPNCHHIRFSFAFARAGSQKSGLGLELIHRFKYQRRIDCARSVAAIAARAFEDERLSPALQQQWPLVPVPLHWWREGWRQFNQAHEMALYLSKEFGMSVWNCLQRIKKTETQTHFNRRQRQKNLVGSFRVKKRHISRLNQAPGVILVDDVFTTGSTVEECSKVLRRAGVEKVIVVTAMRG